MVLVAAFFAAGCNDTGTPGTGGLGEPLLDVAMDQQNGTMAATIGGSLLAKGFNPTNPHLGSAVVATFLWSGPTSIATVHDRLANGQPVGNTYHLVEHVSNGVVTMETYVATNVQGFPDPCCSLVNNGQDSIYVVEAFMSAPLVEGGTIISAYSGVEADWTTALGPHRSNSGVGTAATVASPGAVAADSGALVYGVAMSTPVVGHVGPGAPFQLVGAGSSPTLEADARWAAMPATGSINPEWTWFFRMDAPGTWLASSLVLRSAP